MLNDFASAIYRVRCRAVVRRTHAVSRGVSQTTQASASGLSAYLKRRERSSPLYRYRASASFPAGVMVSKPASRRSMPTTVVGHGAAGDGGGRRGHTGDAGGTSECTGKISFGEGTIIVSLEVLERDRGAGIPPVDSARADEMCARREPHFLNKIEKISRNIRESVCRLAPSAAAASAALWAAALIGRTVWRFSSLGGSCTERRWQSLSWR